MISLLTCSGRLNARASKFHDTDEASFLCPPRSIGIFIATAGLFVAGAAFAGDEEAIKTDRPDFVESSDVVGKGRVQVETSFALERNRTEASRDRQFTTPTLLRFGTGDDLELRLETDGGTVLRSRNSEDGTTTKTRGYSDVSVGVKWHINDGEASTPSTALLLAADLDTGSRAFRGNGTRPSLRWAAEWEMPRGFSLGVMPGLMYDKNENDRRFVSGIFGIVLDKAWNERFHTFIEFAAPQIARARNGGSTVTFDFGATYLLSKSWQIDTAVFRGLNKNTPDLNWTVGISFKL